MLREVVALEFAGSNPVRHTVGRTPVTRALTRSRREARACTTWLESVGTTRRCQRREAGSIPASRTGEGRGVHAVDRTSSSRHHRAGHLRSQPRVKINDVTTHRALVVVWSLLAIPTILFWSESILWVAFMSLYANIAGHWSALEAAKAEQKAEERERERQGLRCVRPAAS